MTAYESPHQLEQSAMLQDTFSDGRWPTAAPPESRYSSAMSSQGPFRAGYYVPTAYTTPQQRSHHVHQSHHIYQGEGYFDSATEPNYHYNDPWAKQQAAGTHGGLLVCTTISACSTPQIPYNRTRYNHPDSARESDTAFDHNSRSFGDINGHYSSPNLTVSIPPANIVSYSTTDSPSFSESVISEAQKAFGLQRVAHQPIPPALQSTYSELSANLQFMDRLEREERALAGRPSTSLQLPSTYVTSTPAVTDSSTINIQSPSGKPQVYHLSASATYLGMNIPGDPPRPSSPGPWIPTQLQFVDPQPQSHSTVSPIATTPPSPCPPSASTVAPRNLKEPKKPSQACDFCKERKIACGRPPQGSADPTCNQCQLRSFKCVYPKERIPRRPRSRK